MTRPSLPRPIAFTSLLIAALSLASGCGESASSGATPVVAPGPAGPAPAPAAGRAAAQECSADVHCATTVLPDEAVASAADCCFPTCTVRVAQRARVEALQSAFGATCEEVQCAPQSCRSAPDPIPVCRSGRCVAAP